jgi:hypothetical protein
LVPSVDPDRARFPDVARGAGHYESFFLKACEPAGRRALWIRYTVHQRPGDRPTGSLWFTFFDADAERPRAHKVTVAGPSAPAGEWIRVGEAALRPGCALGAVDGLEWDLRFSSAEAPLCHLPRAWMYRAPLPKTKLVSPAPAARFDGSLSLDGVTVAVEAWRGTIGHNWGSQHAERWIWLHGLTPSGDWLDAAIGRLKLGRLTTPWVANGVLSFGGERHVVGGLAHRVRVRETPTRCVFVLPGEGLRLHGAVSAAPKDFVGWVYADPDGGEHHTVNCSIADLSLRLERDGAPPEEFAVEAGAAYELGMRERDHGVPIEPFPDG